jgi:hypothetical protein
VSLIREATYAGRFYPAAASGCDALANAWLTDASVEPAMAGLAPHAGWTYSGPTAALSIKSISRFNPETIVIFGAVHVPDPNKASLFHAGQWRTPYGSLPVDEELAKHVARIRSVRADPSAHAHEHSIEVELPIIRRLLDDVKILPLMVRPGPWAAEVGRDTARAALDLGRRVVFLASTDLTHYGPAFQFEPQGHGTAGIRWAKDVNDRRFVDLVRQLEAEAVVAEARAHRNACGSGAVAATIAAAIEAGAVCYSELKHTTSAEVDAAAGQAPGANSVGYEAGIFLAE